MFDVYRNLTQKCLSVRNPYLRLVVAHASHLHLSQVEFVVDAGGKRRAIETGVRNVHAYLRGRLIGADNLNPFKDRIDPREFSTVEDSSILLRNVVSSINVSYHPFTNLGFVDPLGEVLHYADHVLVNAQGRMTAYFTS